MRIPISRQFALLAFLTFLILAPLAGCESSIEDAPPALALLRPADDQLSLAGEVQVRIQVPPAVTADDLVVALDGTPVEIALHRDGDDVVGMLPGVEVGDHVLSVEALGDGGARRAEARFETIALHNPDECEILNNTECLLPYPSSRSRSSGHAHRLSPGLPGRRHAGAERCAARSRSVRRVGRLQPVRSDLDALPGGRRCGRLERSATAGGETYL